MARKKQSKATRQRKARQQSPKPRRRRSRRGGGGSDSVLELARQARAMAGRALEGLRQEIRDAEKHLEELVASEKSFRIDLFGGASSGRSGPTRRSRPARRKRAGKSRRPARPKGPTKADGFLAKLPKSFTLEEVRKVAGGLTGVSLAQWGRAKKVKKVGKGKYQKAA